MLFLSPDPVSGEPHLPQKRIPGGLLNPQFEQFKDISNKWNHLNYQIFPAKCFSPYCLQTKVTSVRWYARRNHLNLLYQQSIYHGKAFSHLSKALPQERIRPGILLTQIYFLVIIMRPRQKTAGAIPCIPNFPTPRREISLGSRSVW